MSLYLSFRHRESKAGGHSACKPYGAVRRGHSPEWEHVPPLIGSGLSGIPPGRAPGCDSHRLHVSSTYPLQHLEWKSAQFRRSAVGGQARAMTSPLTPSLFDGDAPEPTPPAWSMGREASQATSFSQKRARRRTTSAPSAAENHGHQRSTPPRREAALTLGADGAAGSLVGRSTGIAVRAGASRPRERAGLRVRHRDRSGLDPARGVHAEPARRLRGPPGSLGRLAQVAGSCQSVRRSPGRCALPARETAHGRAGEHPSERRLAVVGHRLCGPPPSPRLGQLVFQRRLGFVEKGRLRDRVLHGGRRHDLVLLGMPGQEFTPGHRT